jgi:thiol:disulfide interchange protein
MARTSQRHIPLLLFVLAIALVAGRVAMAFVKPKPEATGLVRWVTPEEGVRLARQSGKPLLLDFTADWCQPCHVLDAEVFRNAELAAEINARFVPVRVVDRQQEEGSNRPDVEALQRRYGVRGFPTVVFASEDLTERARMEGFRGRDEFRRLMESAR